MERLQKLLSIAGVASRRASEELITQGRVEVNGDIVRTLGSKADPTTDVIKVDGRRLRFDIRPRYLVLNKPKNVVTTRKDPEGRATVIELLRGVREYVYPVGRLDYDSEGLLLLTSDGDLAARLTHPRHAVPRVYEAIVAGAPTEEALDKLRRGIFLDGSRTAPAQVKRAGTVAGGRDRGRAEGRDRDDTGGRGRNRAAAKRRHDLTRLTITLQEGRNRQVRRMCASIGHPVRKLTRTRMGPIRLGDLRPGHWRDLTDREIRLLREAASLPSRDAPSE